MSNFRTIANCFLVFVLMEVGANCQDKKEKNNENVIKQNSVTGQDSTHRNGNQYSIRPRNRCCPYNFDRTNCKIVDDRILCGYNINKGQQPNAQKIQILSEGCRLRGGRVECGYNKGPYTGIRRPPGTDSPSVFFNNLDPDYIENTDPDPNFTEKKSSHSLNKYTTVKTGQNKSRAIKYNITNNESNQSSNVRSTKNYRASTKCVEINDRIVCKSI